MELDVKRVGLQSCFVGLPHSLLEILLADDRLPPFPFVLELTPVKSSGEIAPCFVAWDGAASSSSAIEVPETLADCIGLPSGARVRVRARGDTVAAETVVVEPATADDWEILELNANYLENHILSKVGVLTNGQRFPVWVSGQVVLTLRVTSTSPKTTVRLVPGAELVVAPKKRQLNKLPTEGDIERDETLPLSKKAGSHAAREASFRVQELDSSLVKKLDLVGITCTTTPSTAIFIAPDTAKAVSFEDGQLVVLSSGQKVNQGQPQATSAKGLQLKKSQAQEGNPQLVDEDLSDLGEETPQRDAIVRLKFWNGVAADHVMIALPLRVYVGAKIHMRVQLQSVDLESNVQPSALVLSPVLFRLAERDSSGAGGHDDWDSRATSGLFEPEMDDSQGEDNSQGKWHGHRLVLSGPAGLQSESNSPKNDHPMQLSSLLIAWLQSQAAYMDGLPSGQGTEGIPLRNEALVHISISPSSDEDDLNERRANSKCPQSSSMPDVFTRTGHRKRGSLQNVIFLLGASFFVRDDEHHERHKSLKNRQLLRGNGFSQSYFLSHKQVLPLQDLNFEQQKSCANGHLALEQGHPRYLPCIAGMNLELNDGPDLKALTWLEGPASECLARLEVLLFPRLRSRLQRLGTPLPGSVLLYGPRGCGKTQLALALARELQDDHRVLCHRVLVSCSDLVGEQAKVIRGVIEDAVQEGILHAPSLIILDDLDILLPVADSEGPEPFVAVTSLAEFLADLMDVYQGRRNNDYIRATVTFLAVAKAPTALPACLCHSGRFDYHVQLAAPAANERAAILTQVVKYRGLKCSASVAAKAAQSCDGADALDMEHLLDKAVHAAASRFLSQAGAQLPSQAAAGNVPIAIGQRQLSERRKGSASQEAPIPMQKKQFVLLDQDFTIALKDFVPLAMRGVGKVETQTRTGWEDVGGLDDTRTALQEMLEMPVKYSKIFEQAPLRLRTGVLLYGPPGCGKTHIVGAASAACSLRLISVKGPELLNKYIGASEQGVRDVFARATAAAPCILFFDEFDAIAPQRGHDNTGVTDRVVNQLLTELDGVEALHGVFVFAATSRPDLLDAALLRPGRLDRLLMCDFPSSRGRAEILQLLSRKLLLADDVDLDEVASMTEGFSGADLQAILSDAQLESVHSFLETSKQDRVKGTREGKPVISMDHLRQTASKARPSVAVSERRRLYAIYDTFIGSKRAPPVKRDVKGKRATLG